MRIKILLPILFISMFISGCIPSLNPIFTEKDQYADPELIGNWIDDENRDSWTFEVSENSGFELIQKSEKTTARFEAHLVRLGGLTFLDVFPKEPSKAEFKNGFYKLHFVPAHTFSKITIEKDRLQIALFEEKWLDNMLAENKLKIRYERSDSGTLITSSTAELQQMLTEHGNDPEMFQKPIQLRRKQNEKESVSTEKETVKKETPPTTLTIKEQSTTVVQPEPRLPFEFHVNFWINLHHFLYQQVRFQEQATTDKLTPAERVVWTSVLDYYKQSFAKRDLLFDEEMVKIKDRLSTLESSTELKDSGLPAELIKTLDQAAPIYRKYWWPEHERANQDWIKNLKPLLQRFAGTLTEELGAAYREKWPDKPVRVDVAVKAGRTGAYTTLDPTHITISSTNDQNQGLAALEVIFHEASHALVGATSRAIAREFKARNKEFPRDLWHALLFYTTGEIVKRTLKKNGMGDYTPYAYHYGLYDRAAGWKNYQRVLELHWQPYLDGKTDADSALARMIEAF